MIIFTIAEILNEVERWKRLREEKWADLTDQEQDEYHIVCGLTLPEILNCWHAAAQRWQAKETTT